MQTRWASEDSLPELVIQLNEKDRFNKISIFEYCDVKSSADGFSNVRINRIQSYTIDIWKDNSWITIYTIDEPMGDCKVIRFPRYYQTSKIRLKVLRSIAPPSIYEFNVINFKNNR